MSPFEKQIADRVERTGDTSQGQWNFVADLLGIICLEAARWTRHYDDAIRIPEVIGEYADAIRERAKAPAGGGCR